MATIDTTGITGTYNNYVLVWNNLSETSSSNLLMQLSVNGGSTYLTSGYIGGANQMDFSSVSFVANARSTSAFLLSLSPGGESSNIYNGMAWLFNMTSAVGKVAFRSSHESNGDSIASNLYAGISAGSYVTGSITVNAFKVFPALGTISGTISLYGIAQ